MKICQECAASADADALTCLFCGGASWTEVAKREPIVARMPVTAPPVAVGPTDPDPPDAAPVAPAPVQQSLPVAERHNAQPQRHGHNRNR